MIINNFLTNRKSIRDFRDKAVSSDMLDKIRDIVKNLISEEDIDHIGLRLYENGNMISENLEGKAGYGGVMINSPHYIALDLIDKEEDTVIEAGYYMEKLITEIINLGLGTCWIQLGDVTEELKRQTFGNEIKHVNYILAFGIPKRRNPFGEESFSVKKGVEELVYDVELDDFVTVEDLENRGLMDIFYYVRFAPSTKNLQPWRFLIKDNTVELLLRYDEWYDAILIDAGIVMYYFEELANYNGMHNKWQLVKHDEIQTEEYKYRKIAKYKL